MEIKKILVVDDEQKILDVVAAYLLKEGFTVSTANDGDEAWTLFNQESFHLVILDLMLPKISGEEVCRKIRAVSAVPVIMLTAKTEIEEKLEGLAIGADDYLTKPFSARELVGRVKALLRRTYTYKEEGLPPTSIIINNGELEVDTNKMAVKRYGIPITLTTNEFKVLSTLLLHRGQVLTREQLIEKSLGMDYEGFDRSIDTYIKNIRQKLEKNPKEPKYIKTIYRTGYKFEEYNQRNKE